MGDFLGDVAAAAGIAAAVFSDKKKKKKIKKGDKTVEDFLQQISSYKKGK